MSKKTQTRRRQSNVEEGIATAPVNPEVAVLQGRCIVCSASLMEHFKGGHWSGCAGASRSGDTLFVPPMTVLLTPRSEQLAPEAFAAAIDFATPDVAHDMGALTRRASDAGHAAARSLKRQFRTIVEKGADVARRGRVAYLYFAGPKAAPKDITEGDAKFYKTVASHKKGLTFKDIVSRTKLPASTADWARIRLMKSGALIRRPMHA